MDVSKLPKLSDTKTASGVATDNAGGDAAGDTAGRPIPMATPATPYRERPATPGIGVDVWISTVIGLLFLSLGFTFAKFAVAKLTHQPFPTGVEWKDPDPRAGQEVAYFDLEGYTAWTEMGMFLFGLTLLFEAASKAAVVVRPGMVTRAVLVLAMGLTVVTVVLNVWAGVLLLRFGITPIMSGLAVAFGGWVLFDEWHTLTATRGRPAAGA